MNFVMPGLFGSLISLHKYQPRSVGRNKAQNASKTLTKALYASQSSMQIAVITDSIYGDLHQMGG